MMQYKIKQPSQPWSEAELREREPDTLHDIILGGHGITMHGGLWDGIWDWELMERCFSSGQSFDGLKTDWFDYHDDYQAALKPCPNLEDKIHDVEFVQMPSGHHRGVYTDNAGRVHKLSFQLIAMKKGTFQQVACSVCGVVAEKPTSIPIMTDLTEVKRWRNKQKSSFSITKVVPMTSASVPKDIAGKQSWLPGSEDAEYNEERDAWFKPTTFNFKSFYQAFNYAIGKPAQTTNGMTIRRDE
jgi:hypothetical protein